MVDPSNDDDVEIPSLRPVSGMGRSGQPTRDDYSSFAPRIKVVDEWTRDGIAEVRAGMRALRLMMGAVLLAIVLLAVFLAVGASR